MWGLALTGIALLVVGCGGERSFEPDEFVEAANREGADLVLGDSLTSITEDVEVFAISFREDEDEHAAEGEDGHAHSGGSMIVADDAETAVEEYERCESSVSLVCYRAANVVLYFDADPSEEHVAKVDAAIRELATD